MEIWEAIRKDGEAGARRLVSEFGDRLFAAAALLCPNDADAEELVFRSLEQAVRKIGLYRPGGDFFVWLYTIMLNFRRMDLRRRRVELVMVGSATDLPECADSFVCELVRESGHDVVGRAVAGISPLLGEVVRRYYYQEQSVARIAQELKISEGTVKSRLHNAREILRDLLEKKRRFGK